MATAALKMAAICMLLLTTMGQLMAAASASAPLVQADAAPTARRLLSADHERSASEKTGPCPCLPPPMFSPVCCRGLQKAGDCPCTPWTMRCCSGLQKTAENCPCHPVTPWCCFGAGSAATN